MISQGNWQPVLELLFYSGLFCHLIRPTLEEMDTSQREEIVSFLAKVQK